MTTNRRRGEVEIDFGADSFILRYDLNAICTLEQRLGLPLAKILPTDVEDAQNISLNTIREMLLVGIQHRGNKRITARDVGEMMDFQQIAYYVTTVMKAITESLGFDADAAAADDGDPGNEEMAQAS
jgi:hypothetical protein